MSLVKIFSIIFISFTTAYIFNNIDDSNEKVMSLVNFSPNCDCRINETIYSQIIDIRVKYQKIKELTDDEIKMINNENFKHIMPEVCESKRNLARSITDSIEPISQFCASDLKLGKTLSLNTLLMLQTKLEFFCNMNEEIFDAIYNKDEIKCINQKMNELSECRKNSFKIFFFMKSPDKLYWMQLVNGNVCNFNYDSMLLCAKEHLKECANAIEVLVYLFDAIKNISICYKRRNIADIIDDS